MSDKLSDLDGKGEEENNSVLNTDAFSTRNTGLHICRIIVGIMLVFIATVFCLVLAKNAWNKSEESKVIAQVEQVYDQYTKADVYFVDDNLKQVQRTVWLDEAGIRAGDYVICYTNEEQDSIFASYDSITLIVPGIMSIILLIVFVLLCVEIRKKD